MSNNNNNNNESYYLVPRNSRTVYELKRGGRLGVTVAKKTGYDTWHDDALWVFFGLVFSLMAWYWEMSFLLAAAMLFLGGFVAGLGYQNALFKRRGEVVEGKP